MKGQEKTKEQLVSELAELRQRIAELDAREVEYERMGTALHELGERYRRLVELSADMIFTLDREGVFQAATGMRLRELGLTPERVVGRSLYDLLPAEEARWYRERQLQVFEDGTPISCEHPFEFGGVTKTDLATIYPIRDESGEVGLVEVVCRDITDRKRAEEALQESEERFRQLAETIQDVFWLGTCGTGNDRQILYVSPAFEKVFGVRREEIYVSDNAWLEIVHAQDRDRVLDLLEGFLRDQNDYDVEYRIVHPDGSLRWIWARGFAIRGETGEIYRTAGLAQDVTARKQAEEALRESEERFRQMAENSRDVFWMRDLKSRDLIYITPAYERLWGRSFEDAYAEPTSWTEHVHPEDRVRIDAALERQGRGEPTENEYRIVWPDGSIHWIRDRVFPILDEAGEAYRMLGVVEDITERKQAEETLRFLSSIAEQVQDSVVVTDLDHRITYINKATEELFGYSQQELAGKKVDILNAQPLAAQTQREIYQAISQGKVWSSEHLDRKKDGSVFPCELKISSLIDEQGQVCGYVGVQRDITERKRVEEERERLLAQVQEQVQRVQQIIDTVPEGVILLDASGQVILANPLGERDLVTLASAKVGGTLTRLGDRPLVELLTSPPKGLWHEVAAGGRSFQISARPVEYSPTPTGWVMVIRDVTQQREMQQRVQQQERLAAVGQLAAGIAHDFNNIMATVVLYAQMTARMEGLPGIVQTRMETINQQAWHATKLIDQILDFSRRAVLERRPLDLAPLLKEHIKLLERTLPESIEIRLDHEPDEYVVNADPTRMQQMITNLALNAREAMRGGGELRIGLERIEIKPGESPLLPEMEPGEWVRVTVSDTGTGIPPDVLPHIFEPFFTTRAPLGSGLGLAQVHGIVGAHEGRIDVETQVGQGTTFIIYLPVHLSEPSPVLWQAELPALPTGQGETILVVEDDAVVQKALVDSLELLNYRVLKASNGQEALAVLERHRGEVALVLSDVVMPQMGGMALLHALKERGLAVRVVMLTGHPLKRELEELRAQGMADWLPKPPQLEQLAEVVARALGTA